MLIPFIKKWEGGYVDDPDDTGGATNMGVTMATYEAYCRKKGYPRPTKCRLKAMSDATWKEIFKTMYWDKCQGDRINSQSVANMLVDWYWCSGNKAAKKTQKVLGLKQDGIIGPLSIAAINSKSPLPLFGMIAEERRAFIRNIVESNPVKRKYLRGWMNRINNIIFED